MPTLYFRAGKASARLISLDTDLWALSNLWSGERGQGHARAVMEQIAQYADDNQLVVKLMAREYGRHRGLTNQQLEEFYKKFGFVTDRDVLNPHPIVMTRLPREKN